MVERIVETPPSFLFLFFVFHSSSRGKREVQEAGRWGRSKRVSPGWLLEYTGLGLIIGLRISSATLSLKP